MLGLVALLAALNFTMVTPPGDTTITPSFALQGYTVSGDLLWEADNPDAPKTIVDDVAFLPSPNPEIPAVARVSFIAPITGRCGFGFWEVKDGKTEVAFMDFVDTTKGERQSQPVPLPEDETVGLVVLCAVVEGEGAGANTMVSSSFYQVVASRTAAAGALQL